MKPELKAQYQTAFSYIIYGRCVSYPDYRRRCALAKTKACVKGVFDLILLDSLAMLLAVNDEGCKRVRSLSALLSKELATQKSHTGFPLWYIPEKVVEYDTCWSNVGYSSPFGTSHFSCALTGGVVCRHQFSRERLPLHHASVTSDFKGVGKGAGAMDPTGLRECMIAYDAFLREEEGHTSGVVVAVDGDQKSGKIFDAAAGEAADHGDDDGAQQQLEMGSPAGKASASKSQKRKREEGAAPVTDEDAPRDLNIGNLPPDARMRRVLNAFKKARCRTHTAKNIGNYCRNKLCSLKCNASCRHTDKEGKEVLKVLGGGTHRFVKSSGIPARIQSSFQYMLRHHQEAFLLSEESSFRERLVHFGAIVPNEHGVIEHNAKREEAVARLVLSIRHLPFHYMGEFQTGEPTVDFDPVDKTQGSGGWVDLATTAVSRYPVETEWQRRARGLNCDELNLALPGFEGPYDPMEYVPFEPKTSYSCELQQKKLSEYLEKNVIPEAAELLTTAGMLDVNFCESHHHQWMHYRGKNQSFSPVQQILLVELGIAHTNDLVLASNGEEWCHMVALSDAAEAKWGISSGIPAQCLEAQADYLAFRAYQREHRNSKMGRARRALNRYKSVAAKNKAAAAMTEHYCSLENLGQFVDLSQDSIPEI